MREARPGIVLVIATTAPGGIAAVLQGYRDSGFAARHGLRFLTTHRPGSVGLRLLCALSAFVRAAVLMARGRVRLLHCHVAAFGSFYRKSLFAELARCFGVPVVWHVHASELERFLAGQGRRTRRWTVRQFERATVTIVLSNHMAGLVRSVCPRARLVIVPNAVAGSEPCRSDTVPCYPMILSLGLIGARKGGFDLIAAFALIARAHPRARLVLAGNGDREAALRLATELGVAQRVDCPGWVAGDDKRGLLQHAAIYALPSHAEGLPVSLLEAMAQGLPVITTAVGGIGELVAHGRNGLVVGPGDVVALADALSVLLADPARRAELGAAAAASIERDFGLAAVLPRLEAVYAEATRSRPARPELTDLRRLLAAFPEDQRVYAIGDIHGCDDLLAGIHRQIDVYDAQAPAARAIEIVLGDMIDRGPDSRGVIERLLQRRQSGRDLRMLLGNHEAMMLEGLRDPARFPHWLRQGGLETLQSYGVPPPAGLTDDDLESCIERFRAAMPETHWQFFAGLDRAIDLAGFAFVHAGLRPGTAFAAQAPDDLIWIREPFLSHDAPLDRFVIHGHTPGERVELRPHRIDLDTGAFHNGRLSCLMIERGRMRLTDSRGSWADFV